ncbi:hypothetical protein [Escherichia coli]|uniref:hypothetical protein n=1 Tax=Escherichia coli TaxID=562 RepID=UPI001F4BBE27|nr:hypothetical protein [Escherichia coli]
MNRIIPAGCLAALFLAGCNSPSQHTPVPRNYGAASDVAVTRHTPFSYTHLAPPAKREVWSFGGGGLF